MKDVRPVHTVPDVVCAVSVSTVQSVTVLTGRALAHQAGRVDLVNDLAKPATTDPTVNTGQRTTQWLLSLYLLGAACIP